MPKVSTSISSGKGGVGTSSSSSSCTFSIWVLVLTNLLVLQFTSLYWSTRQDESEGHVQHLRKLILETTPTGTAMTPTSINDPSNSDKVPTTDAASSLSTTATLEQGATTIPETTTTTSGKTKPTPTEAWKYSLNPLSIPPGQAQALPSIRVQDSQVDKTRSIYGGEGDKPHLGGFTDIDIHGVSPLAWTKMIKEYGVRSFLDVGCGRGISTRFFYEHGADVLCVEGSHDAVKKTFLPFDRIVEHDYSRGPWWPEKTYDMAWSVEFLEHVSRQYHFNYISTFRKAALIFVTSSRWGGWHHVEVHPDDWWIRKFESYGFRYDANITNEVKGWVVEEQQKSEYGNAPNGKKYAAVHVASSLKVFVNPVVAALPEHVRFEQ